MYWNGITEMAWRHGWRLFLAGSNRSFKLFAPVSCRSLSAQTVCLAGNLDLGFPEKTKVILTHQFVNSTLLNCSSDLFSLSFFFWCAKQPNYFHGSMAFDHMVGVLSRLMRRFKTVKIVLMELESIGYVPKAKTFLLLLRIYWRGGMYRLVFEAFEQMNCYGFTPNTFARNVIMDALFKIGSPDAAIKVLKDTPLPNFLTFDIALRNLSKLNDLVRCQDILSLMIRRGYYPNAGTFEMVLNCFCKMGRLAEACQVLSIMITLGIPISIYIWSIMVDGFCRLQRLNNADYLLDKMVDTGCSPNIVTYTTLIKGYMNSHRVNDAFGILNIMESKGYTPDLVLCNILIDSLSKIGRYDDALVVFLGLMKHKLVPDSYTLSSLLSTICLSKRFSILNKLFIGPLVECDLVVYNSLLSCFCKAGFPGLAVELYDEILDKGFTPDKYTFVGLLSGLCGLGRINDALNVYHGILLNYTDLDAHVHTVIMDGLIKVGKFHSAIRVFRKATLKNYPLDVVSYTVAIHGFIKGGRIIEACQLYNQMKEFRLAPTAHTCNLLLSGFFKKRDLELVEYMLNEMIELRFKLSYDNFFRLSHILCKLNHSHLVFGRLIEMRDLGLIPGKVGFLLLYDKLTTTLNVREENDEFVDSSIYEDLSDLAASMG